jgi:hypothetical protein
MKAITITYQTAETSPDVKSDLIIPQTGCRLPRHLDFLPLRPPPPVRSAEETGLVRLREHFESDAVFIAR